MLEDVMIGDHVREILAAVVLYVIVVLKYGPCAFRAEYNNLVPACLGS